jgi:uncharacterized repeat protein (TIGR03803 family)
MERHQFVSFIGRTLAAVSAATLLMCMAATDAGAQSQYQVLYRFSGGSDGSGPAASVINDGSGNLYGTTQYGGDPGCGTVFSLMPNPDGTWTENVIHTFESSDGCNPAGSLIFDSSGNLYGTTIDGGANNLGAVFELTPNTDGTWTATVLHDFAGDDGASPQAGMVFDQGGSLYGTTAQGGDMNCSGGYGCGAVFQLTPAGDGTWTESVIYRFEAGKDGYMPGLLVFDAAGNLYSKATTATGAGLVFRLTPHSGGTWKFNVLHQFNTDKGGWDPSDLVVDEQSNLYGTTYWKGTYGAGTVFMLTPKTGGGWTYKTLYQFRGGKAGGFSGSGVVRDTAGSLYGTGLGGTHNKGVVFKLARNAGGKWQKSIVYSFTESHLFLGPRLLLDAGGNLYGVATTARHILGFVYEITP